MNTLLFIVLGFSNVFVLTEGPVCYEYFVVPWNRLVIWSYMNELD